MNCCSISNYTEMKKAKKWNRGKSAYFIPEKKKDAPGPLEVPMACCVMDEPFPSVSPQDLNCGKKPTRKNAHIEMVRR